MSTALRTCRCCSASDELYLLIDVLALDVGEQRLFSAFKLLEQLIHAAVLQLARCVLLIKVADLFYQCCARTLPDAMRVSHWYAHRR